MSGAGFWSGKPIVGLTAADMAERAGGVLVLPVTPPAQAQRRPRQRDCRYEPPYPGEETVLFTMADPDLVVHSDHGRCFTAYPHSIRECREFLLTSKDEYEEEHRWERRP